MSDNHIRYKTRQETKRIIIHDSHTTPEVEHAEDVYRWHVEALDGARKMGLLGIGYHYIIERDGGTVPSRPHDQIGSHTPGHNMDSIGVCLVGGREFDVEYGVDNFTREQRKALIDLIITLKTLYGDLKVLGHSEVQRYRNRRTPPCPAIDMDLLRDDVHLKENGITI